MDKIIQKDSTDVSLDIFIQDSTSTTGKGLTGLAYDTSGLTCYYHRPGSNAAQLSLATQTVTGAHSDGGFVEIDATNMPGWYRLDLSDAVVATGVDEVTLHLQGASNMVACPVKIQLVDYDPNDGVRMGLTALPNAAAGANGGLPTGDANEYIAGIQGTANTLDDLNDPTAAAVADAVLDEALSGHTTSGSLGEAYAGIVRGAAQAGTLSTTQFTTNLTETTDGHYNGRVIIWITGNLAGQATAIQDYDGSSKILTVTEMTEAPSASDRFVIY